MTEMALPRLLREGVLREAALPPSWRLSADKDGSLSLWTGGGRPFKLDYSRLRPLLRSQPLAKAIGLKAPRAAASGSKPLFVLDVMAGWGREAFLLAAAGCRVQALEAHPLVFAFARAALESYAKQRRGFQTEKPLRRKTGPLGESSGRESAAVSGPPPISLEFMHGSSLDHLKAIKAGGEPDVIYMDPMFCADKKSLSGKPLRILRILTEAGSPGWKAEAGGSGWKAEAGSPGRKAEAGGPGWKAEAGSPSWKAEAGGPGWKAEAGGPGWKAEAGGPGWKAEAGSPGQKQNSLPDARAKELLQEALKKALRRVAVKRHRLEPPLQERPLCSFHGRSVRFDVYKGLAG